jgi:hypothetical protein
MIDAQDIADRTKNAFSYTRFGRARWIAITRILLNHGFDAQQAEIILRSKFMRWAMDSIGEDMSAEEFAQALDAEGNLNLAWDIVQEVTR